MSRRSDCASFVLGPTGADSTQDITPDGLCNDKFVNLGALKLGSIKVPQPWCSTGRSVCDSALGCSGRSLLSSGVLLRCGWGLRFTRVLIFGWFYMLF